MTEQPTTPDPDTTPPQVPGAGDDGGEALERSKEAIGEARDAEASVAAADDITVLDEARAGEHSEDPDGQGGHP